MHYAPTMKEALFDFHVGYWGTAVMAVLFLSLGALVMCGTGESFSDSAVQFTGQVISLYTKALGSWSYPVIVTAATITMFSTTLSCLDAFPRIIREAVVIIVPSKKQWADKVYFGWMMVVSGVALLIIGQFINSMKTLIDIATTLSFLAAPILAYINFHTVTDSHMPEAARPSKALRIFSWLGIVFLSGFSILFIVWRFILS
jgi:Mn2+/Fe2+ NRAMP family transporter